MHFCFSPRIIARNFPQEAMCFDTLSPACLLVIFTSYLLLVRFLRFRRLRNLHSKFDSFVKNPYAMEYKAAHEIAKLHMLDEQQYLTMFSTQWALIRTFAVARGTRLLVATRQLCTPDRVGRRAEDTGVFLSELMAGDMDSPRWMTSLAKVNWLHSKYKNRITNDEMLFTLSVFVFEPIKFIDKWGWRPLTEMERVARFIFWKEIGRRMGIKQIPDTLDDLAAWLEAFEQEEMVFAETNRACADATLGLYLRHLPKLLHGPVELLARSLMDDRTIKAIGWDPAPSAVVSMVDGAFRLRAWIVRNLFLPRLSIYTLPTSDKSGRIYRDKYILEPWYMKQSLWTRVKTFVGSAGRLHVGQEFGTKGYVPEEVGPPEFVESSREEVLQQAKAMSEYVLEPKSEGCPFTFGEKLVWAERKD